MDSRSTSVETLSLANNGIAASSIVPHTREEERLGKIAEFEQSWKSPSLLRPPQKKKLKEYFSLKQGRDGTRALCCFCHKEFGIDDLEIHHKDHKRINNQLSNLGPSCGPCNRDERARWMAASYAEQRSVITHLKKENETQSTEEKLQDQLLKQAPSTFQHSKRYKQQVREYLIQYVKDKKSFDDAVADVEAITGCSHQKAVEYLNAESLSSFAPFRQWFEPANHTQLIAPRKDSEAYNRALKEVQERLENGKATA